MIILAVIIALLASASNALSGVLERRATGTPPAGELFGRHFIKRLLKQKRWLLGEAFNLLGFLLQALALLFGSLTVVQALMMTNLLFLLLILYFHYHVPMRRREWSGGLAICVGLSVLLLVAHPTGGQAVFEGRTWLITSSVVAAFIVASALFVRRIPQPAWRAAIAGTAAGANFALTAAFTKLVVDQMHSGIFNVVTGWELYALLASGAASVITLQSTYGAGPLAVSEPAMQIVDPLLSILIGIIIFGDVINFSPGAVVIEIICGIVIIAGIILLGSSKRIQKYAGL
jgi:drug/metabolite transporter (DMT)-like permease